MLDYGAFCYLDVQKTGSTFIVDFLERHAKNPPNKFEKHQRISFKRLAEDETTFYFISARDPLDQYKSLFYFGLRPKQTGPLRRRLDEHFSDRTSLYADGAAGFPRWLEFMLDPANAHFFEPDYSDSHAQLFGYMTYRYLRLALPGKPRILAPFNNRAQVDVRYKNKALPKVVIRNENLNTEFAALIESHLAPHLKDPEAAIEELLVSENRKNVAERDEKAEAQTLPSDLLKLLQERESFIFEHLGYPLYI